MAPQQNLIDYDNVGGTWSFSQHHHQYRHRQHAARFSGIPNAATGLGLASLLMGFPSGVSLAPAVIPYQYRWKYYAGFLQDDFKVYAAPHAQPRRPLPGGSAALGEAPQPGHFRSGPDRHAGQRARSRRLSATEWTGRRAQYSLAHPLQQHRAAHRLRVADCPQSIPGLTVLRGGYAISHTPTSGLFRIPIPDLSPPAAQFAANGAANGGQVQMDSLPGASCPPAALSFPADGKITNLSGINAVYYLPPRCRDPLHPAVEHRARLPVRQQLRPGRELCRNQGHHSCSVLRSSSTRST